jgi:plastocyanin
VCCALLLVTSCSGGDDTTRQVTENGTTTATGAPGAQVAALDMDDQRRFRPNTVRAAPGSLTLRVANRGALAHNLVFDDRSLGRTSTIDGKASATLTVALPGPGTFTFTCTLHPGMDGQVIVTR